MLAPSRTFQRPPKRRAPSPEADRAGRGVAGAQRYVWVMTDAPGPFSVKAAIHLAVVGAHLHGQPLHHQLSDRSARLVAATRTAPAYRLFALSGDPPKPALVRFADDDPLARSIEVEVWELAAADFATFVDAIAAPLGIGRVGLADGTDVSGFICEPAALADGPTEITAFGGWRAYRAALA